MNRHKLLTSLLAGAACAAAMATGACAQNFNIPGGDLKVALESYMKQSGVALMYPEDEVSGVHTAGASGPLSSDEALSRLLKGTGLSMQRAPSGAIGIVYGGKQSGVTEPFVLAQAAPVARAVETVTVTSSKLGGADVQSIPISITALSQEQLTATQTAGGPDLIKQVPNMTFTKTNFSGYSIQLRGIGTQAISVTTDPAVAVAFNDTPFIRNHFFEQEFYDTAQVEVLRGPQGTLYGRNATAGVVNLTSAKPTDQFEGMASGEIGNYHQHRFEGMLNLPIVDDRLDIRLAGEWTKRQGYSFNTSTDSRIDGRDLWSGRVTIGLKPIENLQAYLVWEHFSESDDRIRSSKQLCATDPGPTEVNGIPVVQNASGALGSNNIWTFGSSYLSQGCKPASLYSPESFQVPNGFSLPYWTGPSWFGLMSGSNPYASTSQSPNLREIQSQLDPSYKAKNDVVELNAEYSITPALTFVSQTGFNHDFLYSTEDYNRFNTAPGVFAPPLTDINGTVYYDPSRGAVDANGVFCDPQLGCSDRLVAEDVSEEHAWQLSQEFRLSSHFAGPFNFSVGGNYMHYETEENYYVFINSLTAFAYVASTGVPSNSWVPGVSDNSICLGYGASAAGVGGHQYSNPSNGGGTPSSSYCSYIDPNPLSNVNQNGHNYFLSQNPYVLNSFAGFGEAYYDIFKDVKLTAGLRYTEDRKHFPLIPSELLAGGWGYPQTGVVNQQWGQFTGRFAANWTPKLDFTDQTLVYGSYAHGYKAGGANPPGAVLLQYYGTDEKNPLHPLGFKPEFVDAFELGTKNTLLDGTLTLNGSLFYYNYENYQISEIVDRTSVNLNFDAHIKGAELEATWEPVPGLRFNFGGGYEDARLAKGSRAIDLMDRADAANHSDWLVVKPFATQASNCVLPTYVVAALLQSYNGQGNQAVSACETAYNAQLDPVIQGTYHAAWGGAADPASGLVPGQSYYSLFNGVTTTNYGYPATLASGASYYGYNPATAPNNGEGFTKDLGGNELPNAPPFTATLGAQYSMPVSPDWAATLRADGYWQADSWWRVFNDLSYDRLHGYANLNLTLILTNQNGWQVMLYDKNVFNTTAITGAFLNSDDSGLTTNVFLTDPKLIGVRVTKNW